MTESNGSPVGPTVGAGLGRVGGAGYDFDPDQIAALIPKWEELRDAIDEDQQRLAIAAQHVKPPSQDAPAQENARRTAYSLAAASQHNLNLRNYAQAWIDALEKANGSYRDQDDAALGGLRRASGTADGAGLYQ